MNNLIFEIGVENIPARFITGASRQMKDLAISFFKEKDISYLSLNTYGTYRRLILYVEGIAGQIPEKEEKFYGPPARLLRNEKGEYTPQARGFASSHGISPDKLIQEEVSGKGLTLCVVKKRPAYPVEKILPEILIEIIKNLEFPKNMIWEETRFRFARPIRNLLAIYNKKRIKISIAGVSSSKFTTASIFKNFKKININSASDYFKNMERNHILVRDDKRREFLIKELDKLSVRTGLKIDRDEALIEENVYLTEYPVCVFVKFPSDFLKLPIELLLLVMKKQLKFFPCYDEKGNIQPYFIGIRDGVSKGQKNVEEGFLNVLEARFRDAIFFYEKDLKTQPADLINRIKKISFQENLGSLADKADRVKKNINYLLSVISCSEKEKVLRAAENLYLDIATDIVREFPELQGIMSYYYAPVWGINDEDIRKALGEVYFPQSANSPLPSNMVGALISISEKIDTIAGDFLIGAIPTGSQDPHGLRRNAYGIVRIILEYGIKLSLRKFVSVAVSNFKISENSNKDKLIESIMDFLFQRVENYFQEKGYTTDILDSVREIFIKEGDLSLLFKRIKAIKEIYNTEVFSVVATLYKRAKNILKNQKVNGFVDKALFEKASEIKLYDILAILKNKKEGYLKEEDFLSAFREIENLKSPLEEFFKEVLVMVEDEKIRNNRLSLVNEVYNFFNDLADISKLQK